MTSIDPLHYIGKDGRTRHRVWCKPCSGRGWTRPERRREECEECDGTGMVWEVQPKKEKSEQ
jgi:DnaJ-class molecular chaperone